MEGTAGCRIAYSNKKNYWKTLVYCKGLFINESRKEVNPFLTLSMSETLSKKRQLSVTEAKGGEKSPNACEVINTVEC